MPSRTAVASVDRAFPAFLPAQRPARPAPAETTRSSVWGSTRTASMTSMATRSEPSSGTVSRSKRHVWRSAGVTGHGACAAPVDAPCGGDGVCGALTVHAVKAANESTSPEGGTSVEVAWSQANFFARDYEVPEVVPTPSTMIAIS